MRHSLAVVLLVAAIGAAPSLRAQDGPSRIELYGGYGFVRFNINTNVSGQAPSQTYNGNGGGGELVFNASSWFGITGDVQGYWATNTANTTIHGPRINFRHGKVTPFAQVLLGGVVTSSGIQQEGWQSHFAIATGGGIDVRISRHFSIRPVQAEYFMTKIPDGLNNRQNNFRFGAGIVFRFG